jgi:diacylglycerol kinase family enzyme
MWGWVLWGSALLAVFLAGVYRWIISPFLRDLRFASLRHEFMKPGERSTVVARRRVAVVVNPAGGDGRARDFSRNVLVPVLRHHQAEVTVLETSQDLNLLDLDQSKVDLIVACCGDGTLAQLVNSRHGLPRVPVCLMPCGSSNGLAWSLGSPDLRSGLASLLNGSPKRCDVLEAE